MQAAIQTPEPVAERLIHTYFRAKDENRPHLMCQVFSVDATLEMTVKSEAISFPATATGLAAITEVLVSSFNQKYENIYSFCVGGPQPELGSTRFSCDWLVGMSEKGSGELRVGCGRYDWSWSGVSGLADRLKITIETMQALPPDCLGPVYDWLLHTPYPWCTADTAASHTPRIAALDPVIQYITRYRLLVEHHAETNHPSQPSC
jgi:hypothetical protein